ncbi:MAG: hypothetical protein R3C11_23160 [Planctomycetaceae bacterium]
MTTSLFAAEKLFVAEPLTAEKGFGRIEGPAWMQLEISRCKFQEQQTIGKTTPTGETSIFLRLKGESVGNGIRFDKSGNMFIADYVVPSLSRCADAEC